MCGEGLYRMQLAALWTEAVLYGIYMMLFTASIYVLIWRRPNTCYLVTTIVLFALTTAYTATDFTFTLLTPETTSSSVFQDDGIIPCSLPETSARLREAERGNTVLFVENCLATALFFVADGILIYRCFMLWGSRIWAISLPFSLLLATTVCNIVALCYQGALVILQGTDSPSVQSEIALGTRSTRFSNIGDWLSLATNIITTFLTALRIWMMTREVKGVLGPDVTMKYLSAIAMVVESGAVFSLSLLADSIVVCFPEIYPGVPGAITQQLLAIAPTLVIVRVGMRQGFDDIQDSLHDSLVSNRRVSASPRFGKDERGHAGSVSSIHFRTGREAEMTVSRIEHDGGIEDVLISRKGEEVAGSSKSMV